MAFNRVVMIVLDSCGIGEMYDAAEYGDQGSNTIGNIAKAVGGLKVPNLERLGLSHIHPVEGVSAEGEALANYGKMAELSAGKDTTNGHWEMVGVKLDKPLPTYPNGFPKDLMDEFEKRIGRKTLGNVPASGTEIIKELGDEHVRTGSPIIYTSGDSVFQIAAHEEVISIEELYKMCKIARELLVGEHAVGRVIARPFVGTSGNYTRTANRHDYSRDFGRTVLNEMDEKGLAVFGVGKIYDIYGGSGVNDKIGTNGNMDGVDKTLEQLGRVEKGLIFTNLVDFDALYGHRNDPEGFAKSLVDFDNRLPEILDALREDDLLILTADHGCDPTTEGTDHSREYVPLLAYGKNAKQGVDLGTRKTFADIGATLAENFGVHGTGLGESFLSQIVK